MTPDVFHGDDNPSVRESLRKILPFYGHRVILEGASVAEVQALVPQIIEKGIKVAILDNRMPNRGDGERAAEILKAQIPDIKIIVFTANPEEVN